jgi:hypothetical protein
MESRTSLIKRPDPDHFRTVGLGKRYDMKSKEGLGALSEDMLNKIQCPVLSMPTIEEVGWLLDGPQTDTNINTSFGGQIDPFHSGKSPAINGTVETTLVQPGLTQTYFVACAIGWHLEPEPLCFTVPGNAFTRPAAGTTKPISPNVYTINDLNNSAMGANFNAGNTSVMVPAVLEWGWWANYAAWAFVQSYSCRWQIGQHLNIIDDSMRNTAYMPPAAQDGSASNSQVDVNRYERLVNAYYAGLAGNVLDFLKVDALRIGSTLGTAGTNVGSFQPTREYEVVEATYGGIGLRQLLIDNRVFRPLTVPYIIKAGVPLGLLAEVNQDTNLQQTFQTYLSATEKPQVTTGGVPPQAFTAGPNYNAGATTAAAAAAQERTLDGFNLGQTYLSQRQVFKGGRLGMKVKIKGFEITEDLYTQLANDSAARQAFCAECGVRFAMQGAGVGS